MSANAGHAGGVRICSVYALVCLSKEDMVNVTRMLSTKPNARIADLEDQASRPGHVVPPREVGSAGRVGLDGIAGRPLTGSLIFTASVPYDLMANVEVNAECTEADCLARCLDYIEIAREELLSLVSHYDVECVTLVPSDPQLVGCKEMAERMRLTELHSTDDVIVYEAPYPYDCLLIFGISEDIVSEVQTALQNLYRVKGGTKHLNRELAHHLRDVVLPLRASVNEYLRDTRRLSSARRLELVRPLRNTIFQLQTTHDELMSEYESLLEYEALYLQGASMSAPRLPLVIGEMESDYLRPLKLLRNKVDALFRGASDYIDGIVATVYADANLELAQKMQVLTLVQSIIAVILFALTIVQAIAVFVK